MSGLDDIKRYKEKCDEENVNKEMEKREMIDKHIAYIKTLKPRIAELINVANACLENGIEINAEHNHGHSHWLDKWEHGTFCTNCITHKIGFVWQYNNHRFINQIETMGIDGGGANGEHYLRTNGDYVVSRIGRGYNDKCQEPDLYQLKRFVETFDEFETEFYKYVDKVVASK